MAGLLDEGGVDRDQGLVQAQHHERQEQAAQDQPGEGAAGGEQPGGEGADGGGDLAGEEHQAENRHQPGDQDGDGRGDQRVHRLGDPPAAQLLHPDGEERGRQGPEYAALAGRKVLAESIDLRDAREDDDRGDGAAEDRGAAELLGRVVADEHRDQRHEPGGDRGERRDDGGQPTGVQQHAVQAGDDAAADERRDQRDEDVGDPAQEQFHRGAVPVLLRLLQRGALGGEFLGGDPPRRPYPAGARPSGPARPAPRTPGSPGRRSPAPARSGRCRPRRRPAPRAAP